MLKTSMDIIDVYAWVQVSSKDLIDCVVENAYRYKYAWLVKLKCRGLSQLLKISPGARIHISRVDPTEKTVDKFSQYLRAHVRGGFVKTISMPWWERVILIETVKRGSVIKHYVELVPRGVWAVSGSDDKILYASKFEDFKDRSIRPGIPYTPPPARGLPPGDTDKLINALLKGRDLVRSVVSNWGLPGYVAEELLLRAGLYGVKLAKPTDVQRVDLENLVSEYSGLVRESITGTGYLVYRDGNIETFTPYKPRLFIEVYNYDVREHADFNEVLDVYFSELESYQEALEKSRKLEKEVEAWKKRVEEQEKAVSLLKSTLDEVNKRLSVIYENYANLEEAVECARKLVKLHGWSAVRDCGVNEYRESDGVLVISVGGQRLEFSVRDSFEKQVQDLIRKRGELEKKLRKALAVLEELKLGLCELEKKKSEKVYTKEAPKLWFEKYRWSITRNSFIVIAGRDAHQNEAVVRKYLQDSDLFLHADVHGAPATVLITRGVKPEAGDIEDAAVIAACYSKAWKAGFSYVEVYWVHGYQVSKAPPPGEYLGKGAFMVYGERHYLRVPLKLGIGLRLFCDVVYGDYVKLYVGSPELVREKSISYVVVVPGEVDQQEVAKEAAKLLVEHAYRRTGVRFEVAPQQLVEVLPGSSRIVEHGVGAGEVVCREG